MSTTQAPATTSGAKAAVAGRPPVDRRARLAEALLAEHGERLHQIAFHNGAYGADAEDALQTALAQFLAHFDGPDEHAVRWLVLVLKRTCWRQARTRGRHPHTGFDELARGRDNFDPADVLEGHAADPADLVALRDEIDRQRAAIQSLPHEQRLALACSALDLSHSEIAEATGWKPRQIRRYVEKGNAALEASSR